MKKLPVGVSVLAKIVQGNYIYVDKTKYVKMLVESGDYYFLSRPRRFGKSLFLDTLKQAFLGNKELFCGLYLENNWDWSVTHPVLHFDLGEGVLQKRQDLEDKLNEGLDYYYEYYNITNKYKKSDGRFKYLLQELVKKYNQQVVVLIDEYDKPILDNIDNSKIAIANREGLKNFYSVLKANEQYLKFVFITGVSKFSKVSLFSGLNNLKDITLREEFADLCGYTQTELEDRFSEHLKYGNVDLEATKNWYNGYNFGGSKVQKVYNPFDILLFLDNNYQYNNYWFETATPTFLIKLLQENYYSFLNLENLELSATYLNEFDVDNMPLETLMWQTGYLTILDKVMIGMRQGYVLGYPNLEVKSSITEHLSKIGTNISDNSLNTKALNEAIETGNMTKFCQTVNAMFASIPHTWYRKNTISQYEGFYATVLYTYLSALGYATKAEDITNKGNIDISVESKKNIIILELKLSKYGTAKDALKQIQDKRYAEKFRLRGKPIYLLGISFDSSQRNVKEFAFLKL